MQTLLHEQQPFMRPTVKPKQTTSKHDFNFHVNNNRFFYKLFHIKLNLLAQVLIFTKHNGEEKKWRHLQN